MRWKTTKKIVLLTGTNHRVLPWSTPRGTPPPPPPQNHFNIMWGQLDFQKGKFFNKRKTDPISVHDAETQGRKNTESIVLKIFSIYKVIETTLPQLYP